MKLNVYDITGREVISLVDIKQNRGYHEVNFNAEKLTSGLYFYTLIVDGKDIQSRKMLFIK